MSLKSLIQWLLDSRTTPEEAGHSAMPQEDQVISYGSTTENPGSWTTILSFTAPKDGYAKAVVVGTGKNSAELYCGNMRVSAFAPVDNASINVVMPVRKGASVGLVSTVFRSAALYFVPSIGGGYNNLVRRALSCLRALSSSLRKISWLARRSGSEVRHSQCNELIFPQSLQNTHLQQTGSWEFTKQGLPQTHLLICTAVIQGTTLFRGRISALSRALHLILKLFPLRRGIRSIWAQPKIQQVNCGLLHLKAARANLSTGGASC